MSDPSHLSAIKSVISTTASTEKEPQKHDIENVGAATQPVSLEGWCSSTVPLGAEPLPAT